MTRCIKKPVDPAGKEQCAIFGQIQILENFLQNPVDPSADRKECERDEITQKTKTTSGPGYDAGRSGLLSQCLCFAAD